MKNNAKYLAQRNAQKRVIKINILYIIAFQLLGFATVLFLEHQATQVSSTEINLALEKESQKINEVVSYQICEPENCKKMLP